MGYVRQDNEVVACGGAIIGTADKKGIIYDKKNIKIGRVGAVKELAFGKNNVFMGYIDEKQRVVDCTGKIVGVVDKNGNIIASSGKVLGTAGNYKRLAYDKDGNVIGYIDKDGTVRDFHGNLIGKMLPDGTIIDKNGNVIGKAGELRQMAIDKDGNIIGYVDEKGRVVDEKGNIIGYIDKDGNVIKVENKKIGKTCIRKKIALNTNGQVIGYLDTKGVVKNFSNKVIGVSSNNNVDILDNKGMLIGKFGVQLNMAKQDEDIIGYIDEKNYVRGDDKQIVGLVDMKGNVLIARTNVIGKKDEKSTKLYNKGKELIGYVKTNDFAYDEKNNIIGYVNENGDVIATGEVICSACKSVKLAYDKNGNIIGYVDENGHVIGADGKILGYVDKNGNIIGTDGKVIGKVGEGRRLAYDKNGNVIGYVDQDGTVRDFKGNVIGRMDEKGNIIDKNGKVIGYAGEERKLAYDKDGNIIGWVDENGNVIDENGNVVGVVDENGNIISPALDANQFINIMKNEFHLIYFYTDCNQVIEIGTVLDKIKFYWEYCQNLYDDTINVKTQSITTNGVTVQLLAEDREWTYNNRVDSDISFLFRGSTGYQAVEKKYNITFANGIYYGNVDEDILQFVKRNTTVVDFSGVMALVPKDGVIPKAYMQAAETPEETALIYKEQNYILNKLGVTNFKYISDDSTLWDDSSIVNIDDIRIYAFTDDGRVFRDLLLYNSSTELPTYLSASDFQHILGNLNKQLSVSPELTLENYVIGNNNYFVYACPKKIGRAHV